MCGRDFASSRVHDLLGSIFGVFALSMLISSPWQVDTSGPDPFYKGPLIFPLLVFGLILAGALPSMWRLVRPTENASWSLDGYGKPIKNMVIIALLVAYPVGILVIGLEVSTWVFLTLALKLVKQDSIAKITLILYIIFKYFLDVWFPEPLILMVL